MGEFLFWIILIPVLFYLIVGFFAKDNYPKDIYPSIMEDEFSDE